MRNFVFAALPTLLLLGILSLGWLGEPENDPWLNSSPLWGPGDPFYSEDPSRRLLLADPVLIWRGRPGYTGAHAYQGVVNHVENNAWGFRDDEVLDPKPEGVTRVLDVGDSATWGLNLPSRSASYSDQLERSLVSAAPGRWEVVNAGTIGYSSFQGVQLLRAWGRALEPDVVTVYLGNNDPAPGGLKDAERASATAGMLQGWLRHNRFYLLAQKGLLHLRAAEIERRRASLAEQGDGRSEAFRSREGHYRLSARVDPAGYERNLRAMVELIEEAGARPVLLKVPMNLVWPPRVRPFAQKVLPESGVWGAVKIEPGYLGRVLAGEPACRRSLAGHPYLCRVEPSDLVAAGVPSREALLARSRLAERSRAERVRDLHNAAIHLLVADDAEAAERELAASLAAAEACGCLLPRERSWMLHNLGVARLVQGEDQAAFEAFLAARATWPFAMSPDYEERFDRVVAELDVEWVDLPRLFAEADPRFRGSALMHDWVHPSGRGNAIIARALEERLLAGP